MSHIITDYNNPKIIDTWGISNIKIWCAQVFLCNYFALLTVARVYIISAFSFCHLIFKLHLVPTSRVFYFSARNDALGLQRYYLTSLWYTKSYFYLFWQWSVNLKQLCSFSHVNYKTISLILDYNRKLVFFTIWIQWTTYEFKLRFCHNC